MHIDVFLATISIFVLTCGSALLSLAWPQQFPKASSVEILALSLGGLMVLMAGYGLAMALA